MYTLFLVLCVLALTFSPVVLDLYLDVYEAHHHRKIRQAAHRIKPLSWYPTRPRG